MSGELIPRHSTEIAQQLSGTDVFGRPRVSRAAVRQFRFEIEQAALDQLKIERARQSAVSGMLAENQARTLADALCGDNPEARMACDDYIRALHTVGVSRVLRAGT